MQADSCLTELLGAHHDDGETFARLAKLPPVEYDRCRETEAKRLDIRVATLDSEVARRRETATDSNAQGNGVDLPDVELWPEPVDGAETLTAVAARFARYVVLPPGAADALALWTVHTHTYNAFLHTPRLNLCSPDKGCGKTTLLDVIAALVPRPLRTESITCAVLFRLVDAQAPTLLLDEVDAYLAENEELRGLLNAGHKRGARALRCEGDKNEVRSFNAFAPAALAGIGHLPGTLHDRSIVVRLVRAKPGEVTARFDSRRTQTESELCRKLARWCTDNATQIEARDPTMPEGAFNRLADNWRPLFTIAEIAGGDWTERAHHAFELLVAKDDADAQGIGTMLLADIRVAFTNTGTDRVFSRVLVESLVGMTDRPWPEAHKGRSISETWLSRRLKAFGITSRTIRVGTETAKGYYCDDFQDAFARFLSDAPTSNRNIVTSPANTEVGSHLETSQTQAVLRMKNGGEANAGAGGDVVTLPNPVMETPADELLV